ncbi:SIR2 family protein [Pseudomonas syringae group sp. J309-1]|uniref:SIR2 family protein n=1 Tax=Pseudomonas syringae group sp. J309-1 TaxID=3079588 RepID=UPI00290F6E2B|nr:SIR2 family protein [Pseudomonas syringae group sp. J309-1]MDU8357653.1 SIR2 family protein [Pseudomonas syringae group sp. J309-1]
MSILLADLTKRINPSNTVLFFGAGSSLPSGAPSVSRLIELFSSKFSLASEGYSLSEITSLAEQKRSRKEMIECLRVPFRNLTATGSLLNLPLYNWKNIYTTNYDNLIEQSYSKKDRPLSITSSNFDFTLQRVPEATKLFKLHGSIEKDEVDGVHSRIVITENDYDLTGEYREHLYESLRLDLAGSDLVVIGYSLADPHIKELVTKALDINSKSHNPATIYLLLYTPDENRALLHERRGIKVAFGGLDDFFVELMKNAEASTTYSSTGDPLDYSHVLRPVTKDVAHEIRSSHKDASAMFNGWPASYADISANLTFRRTQCPLIQSELDKEAISIIVILGASGTGKTTLAKQVMHAQNMRGWHAWEHKSDHTLLYSHWLEVATYLKSKSEQGILFVDDAHNHMNEVNSLVDLLAGEENKNLKLILISARNQWNPRVKTPNIFKRGKQYVLKGLDYSEVDELLTLVDTNPELKPLVENNFSGFSRAERKRRLTVRCESDTFVCLKNIFASEKFDDIVLREFASLPEDYREVYRLVAAMESSGINVHRQLVIRLLGIPAQNVTASLTNLVDIIHEYVISEKDGIYGWKGRHPVITDIISQYKMTDIKEYFSLFEKVIDNIVPTYDVEIRTIRQLCGFEKGINRIPDKHVRNKLLRKMISIAPGERVPRHRLIRNLIDINELEKADTEIRLFENDFKADGPVHRFKIMLLLARAERTLGILDEDRIAILDKARALASHAVDRYKDNKDIMRIFCDVGIEVFKKTKDMSVFDEAMGKLRLAEERIGDPDITGLIIQYQRKISGHDYGAKAEAEADAEND